MKQMLIVVAFCSSVLSFCAGMKYGEHNMAKSLWRPDPTGYVSCDMDGSVNAGNIHIIDDITVDEFKNALERLCLYKRRVRPI